MYTVKTPFNRVQGCWKYSDRKYSDSVGNIRTTFCPYFPSEIFGQTFYHRIFFKEIFLANFFYFLVIPRFCIMLVQSKTDFELEIQAFSTNLVGVKIQGIRKYCTRKYSNHFLAAYICRKMFQRTRFTVLSV